MICMRSDIPQMGITLLFHHAWTIGEKKKKIEVPEDLQNLVSPSEDSGGPIRFFFPRSFSAAGFTVKLVDPRLILTGPIALSHRLLYRFLV